MKFLVMGLLSLCLLFAGCDSFGDFGQNGGGIVPPANESTENGGNEDNGGSSNENQGSNDNNQNKNPFAGGLENGGQFEGK